VCALLEFGFAWPMWPFFRMHKSTHVLAKRENKRVSTDERIRAHTVQQAHKDTKPKKKRKKTKRTFFSVQMVPRCEQPVIPNPNTNKQKAKSQNLNTQGRLLEL